MKFELRNTESCFDKNNEYEMKQMELLKLNGFIFEEDNNKTWSPNGRWYCPDNRGNDVEINSIEDLFQLKHLFGCELIIGDNYIEIYDGYRE
jgi:hypothetical protein